MKKFLNEMKDFKSQSLTVKARYAAVRTLKDEMPVSHVSVQIDHAENYTSNYGEEVQSAYYNKEQITMHPSIMENKETMTNYRGFSVT